MSHPQEYQDLIDLKTMFLDERPFPRSLFPPLIESYLEKKAKVLELDYASVVLTFLGMCSVALGGKKKIRLGDWTEKAILWLALVGKSGMGKTALLDGAGLVHNRDWQSEHLSRYMKAKEDYEETFRTWEGLEKEERSKRFPLGKPQEPPFPRQAFSNVVTVESCLELNAKHPEGIAVVSDELATLLDCKNQYKQGGGNDQGIMLELWTGHDLVKNLTNRTLYVKDPFCCIVGGIQPGIMRKIINTQNIIDGFASRFLFTFLIESASLLKFQEKQAIERSITPEERQAIHDLFQGLLESREKETSFALTPQGELVLREFQYDLDKEARDAAPYLYSPFRKLKTYAMRFALLIHCLKGGQGPIDDQTVLLGNVVVSYLKANTEKAFHLVFQNETEEQQQLILEKVRSMDGKATREKIKQRLKRQIDFKTCGEMINLMLRAEVLREVAHKGKELCLELAVS